MFEWRGNAYAELPRICRVEQKFDVSSVDNVREHIRSELNKPAIRGFLKPGLKAAVAVGSRGIGRLDEIVKSVVDELSAAGLKVFIVPAMGSHGGATAEGQVEFLEGYGISEKTMGVPVRSSMEVVELEEVEPGVPVYFDKAAYEEADLIIPIARVKCHTGFRGPIESGLYKMLVIGLGDHVGAQSVHRLGFARFKELIPRAGELILHHAPAVKFGLAIVENAHDLPSIIEAVPAEAFKTREPELLKLSKARMAKLNFKNVNLLVVREIGKNVTGGGMDPNVTGRFWMTHMEDGPLMCDRIVILDLTEETHGNAMGVGMADAVTRKLVDKIDFHATYTNAITSTRIEKARVPMVLPDDRTAIRIGLQSIGLSPREKPRMVIIKNTLELEKIYVSEGLLEEVGSNPSFAVTGELQGMRFDDSGNLVLPVP